MEITKKEFESFLPKEAVIVEDSTSKEFIYEFPAKNSKLNIRIYSSIDIRTQQSRNLGEDAIRCVLIDCSSNKPIDKGKRTHRMENWKERLKEKIIILQSESLNVKFCNKCGSSMRLLEKNGSKFFGCSRYPICLVTMNIEGQYREKFQEQEKKVVEQTVAMDKIVKCPYCNSPMTKRSGMRGEFYGCSAFSKLGCRGTRQVRNVEVYGEGVEEVPVSQLEKEAENDQPIKKVYVPSKIDVPNDDSHIELIDTKKFPHLSFRFEKFNPVQSRVFQYYDQDINLIVAAATSAGKTTIAEMLMSDSIAKGKKAIFLSPLKAVSQEKYDDWKDSRHDWSRKNVSIVTGDYSLTEKRVEELRQANVIIMTTEMMDSRTRRVETEKNDWLLDVGTVVVDESHLLMMKGRGDRVESALMRFSKQNPACRIILLSATMPNVSELSEWLTSLNGKKSELINSNYRPCQLDLHYVKYSDRGSYQTKESNKMAEVVRIIKQNPEDKFIVFVHAKAIGRTITSLLSESGENVLNNNAELDLKERIRISEEFKSKGGLRIIVATSVLAWGVNLPARRVIITGLHRGLSEVEPLDIKQMCGRSGRVGFDPKGDAYILLPESKFSYYKSWCENIPPITSTMNDIGTLAFHIVSEISDGDVDDIGSLMDWYNRSLAAYQNNMLDRIEAEKLLNDLEKLRVIEKVGEKYKITKLGQVAAHLYFSPYSIAGWYFNFKKIIDSGNDMDDTCISWALANLRENTINFVPKEFSSDVANYKSKCLRKGLTIPDGCAWIGYVYESCLSFNESLGELHKKTAKFDTDRTFSALAMIDQRFANWKKKEYWEKLQMRIQYEITWDQTELCSLRGIGGVFVRRLFNAGIKTIRDFKRDTETALEILGEKRYEKVVEENQLG